MRTRHEAASTAVDRRCALAIRRGARAQVEASSGETWTAQVRYVEGDVLGLRGTQGVNGRFAEHDDVALIVGCEQSLVATQARVLSSSGTTLRVRQRASEGPERHRRAVRVRVALPTRVEAIDFAGEQCDAIMVDLSMLGCALQTSTPQTIGNRLRLTTRFDTSEVTLTGTVVRTWIAGGLPSMGINFDPNPHATHTRIERFLLSTLHETVLPPRARMRNARAT